MFGFMRRFARLREEGVLGINMRNSRYILRYNPRRLYPLVDDKLRTKRLALANGIATPELYHVVQSEGDVHNLEDSLAGIDDFVVKPAHGSGGEGILVISETVNDRRRLIDGAVISSEELHYHVFNVLSGLYSLGGQPDQVLFEYRVKPTAMFEAVTHQGVPDIRILVFLGVPVMAMIRLPTRKSGGKANLHQGAIGAGIDMASGRTVAAVWGAQLIEEHPETGNSLLDIEIPEWPALLELAAKCHETTGLGYQGIDICLDADRGPLILELNARPGLNIQIANRAGLLPRLRLIEESRGSLHTPEERAAFARERFGLRPPPTRC